MRILEISKGADWLPPRVIIELDDGTKIAIIGTTLRSQRKLSNQELEELNEFLMRELSDEVFEAFEKWHEKEEPLSWLEML